MNNLFSCLWFNEVHLFTPRDQLSFGYVVYRLGDSFKFFMFPNCEYNSLFLLHPHTREHSSPVEWVKRLDELKDTSLKESRGGLGLWTPYPGDLASVVLPNVTRTSKAGWQFKYHFVIIAFQGFQFAYFTWYNIMSSMESDVKAIKVSVNLKCTYYFLKKRKDVGYLSTLDFSREFYKWLCQ